MIEDTREPDLSENDYCLSCGQPLYDPSGINPVCVNVSCPSAGIYLNSEGEFIDDYED